MEILTRADRKLKNWAGFLGIIQSIAWIIMSAISIGLHLSQTKTDLVYINTYMDAVRFLMYDIFIKDEYHIEFFFSQTVTNSLFVFFSVVYLILDLVWLIASLNIMCRQNNLRISFKIWSSITFLICLFDFIVVVILGSDYGKCMNFEPHYSLPPIVLQIICVNGILPVLLIASKGFVLWIVNAIFAYTLITVSPQRQIPVFQNISYGNPQPQPQPQLQPQLFQPPTSPIYENPYPQTQNPSPLSPVPQRKWNVHSGVGGISNIPRESASNYPSFLNQQNVRPYGQILSNQTREPFVLKSAPVRF